MQVGHCIPSQTLESKGTRLTMCHIDLCLVLACDPSNHPTQLRKDTVSPKETQHHLMLKL